MSSDSERARRERLREIGTPLERRHGFRNPNFTEYMTTEEPLSPEALAGYVDSLGQSNHPIVQLAAGSAAFALALHKTPFGNGSAKEGFWIRDAHLQTARRYFMNVIPGLYEISRQHRDTRRGYEAARLEFWAEHSEAYVWAGGIVAAGLEGYELKSGDIGYRRMQTIEALAELAHQTASFPSLMTNRQQYFAMAEMTCGAAAQLDPEKRYFAAPAPLPQRLTRSRNRAAMVALSAEPYCQIPIQFQIDAIDQDSAEPTASVLRLAMTSDLALDPEHGVDFTLERFIHWADSDAPMATTEAPRSLRNLGSALGDQLDAYARKSLGSA